MNPIFDSTQMPSDLQKNIDGEKDFKMFSAVRSVSAEKISEEIKKAEERNKPKKYQDGKNITEVTKMFGKMIARVYGVKPNASPSIKELVAIRKLRMADAKKVFLVLNDHSAEDNSRYLWESYELIDMLNDVCDFNERGGERFPNDPSLIPKEKTDLFFRLMEEELLEYKAAVLNGNVVEIFDALIDLQYVLLGGVLRHGLSDVFEKGFQEVHSSNMTKVKDGVQKDESGKIMKPFGYKKPDLLKVLKLHYGESFIQTESNPSTISGNTIETEPEVGRDQSTMESGCDPYSEQNGSAEPEGNTDNLGNEKANSISSEQ